MKAVLVRQGRICQDYYALNVTVCYRKGERKCKF